MRLSRSPALRTVRRAGAVARRAAHELRDGGANARRTSARHQLDVWRHGFYARQARMFDFRSHGFDPFASELHRRTRLAALNREGPELGDKLAFSLSLDALGVPVPLVHGHGNGDEIVLLDAEDRAEELEGLLRRAGRLIVKPRDGSCGDGVVMLDTATASCWPTAGRPGRWPGTSAAPSWCWRSSKHIPTRVRYSPTRSTPCA